MKSKYLVNLASFGLKTILFKWKKPILGTVILTDYCNLECKHCGVNNINKIMHSYENICNEMQKFYDDGIRILFLSGGEPMLWEYGERDVKDLIRKGREIGFYIINVVTNGTVHLNIPEADVVFLSVDGMRESHNSIRGEVFDRIMDNIEKSGDTNICVYSAINKISKDDIRPLSELVKNNSKLNSISFNFHTPYPDTLELSLSGEDKLKAVNEIKSLIKEGYPVFNLYSTLDLYLENNWERPCSQCVVSENGERFICGRCSERPRLCDECGFLFAVEFSALFSGNFRAIMDMFRTYTRFV